MMGNLLPFLLRLTNSFLRTTSFYTHCLVDIQHSLQLSLANTTTSLEHAAKNPLTKIDTTSVVVIGSVIVKLPIIPYLSAYLDIVANFCNCAIIKNQSFFCRKESDNANETHFVQHQNHYLPASETLGNQKVYYQALLPSKTFYQQVTRQLLAMIQHQKCVFWE